MNFYTGNCKFNKSDFESNDEEEDEDFIDTSSKGITWKLILLFIFVILATVGVLYFLNKTGKI